MFSGIVHLCLFRFNFFVPDLCSHPGTTEIDAASFRELGRGWHIDGLPTDFIPGQTDHWGTIRNFDMLIGGMYHYMHPMTFDADDMV